MHNNIKYYFAVLEEMLFIPLNTSNQEIKKIFGAKNSIKSQIRTIIGAAKESLFDNGKSCPNLDSDAFESFWFYSVSQNTLNALTPLFNETRAKKLFMRLGQDVLHDKTKITGLYSSIGLIELTKALMISVLFAVKQKKARPFLARSFKSLVAVYESRRLLRHCNPKLIFFSNDHGIGSRAMLVAARERKIPTVYLQHACISDIFPPLGYSIALLDGRDAVEKYQVQKNTNCIKYEVGMMKFEKYKHMRNYSAEIRNVGICINLLDHEDNVLNLVNYLSQEYPEMKISIRFHPRYNIEGSKLATLKNIRYSGKEENAFDFLSKQDLCISGNSSIHLEAVLMNVISVQYDFGGKFSIGDYYGFIKNGLVLKADSFNDILLIIKTYRKSRPLDWFRRADHYVRNNGPESCAVRNAVAALRNEKIDLFR